MSRTQKAAPRPSDFSVVPYALRGHTWYVVKQCCGSSRTAEIVGYEGLPHGQHWTAQLKAQTSLEGLRIILGQMDQLRLHSLHPFERMDAARTRMHVTNAWHQFANLAQSEFGPAGGRDANADRGAGGGHPAAKP